jgi:phospholipid/cholesterol/gamma-HCH transport system ATP-binding protein
MPVQSENSTVAADIELGGERPIEHRRESTEPYIRFVHVSKSFDDHLVLDDVSFDVKPGEMVVVMGKSGVGKSVILKHLMGFLRPDSGQVWVGGYEVSELPEAKLLEVRRCATMVFQSGALFDSLTVAENVAYPLRERALRKHPMSEEQIQARVDELLSMVDLVEMREQMPSDLSTGMKRAVAIARGLAAEPECLLYDEPTTMVDPLMAGTIGDLILKLKHKTGLTSVVVTHDVKLAHKLADRVVFLVDGRVAFFGSIRDFDASEVPMVQGFIYLDEVALHPDRARGPVP